MKNNRIDKISEIQGLPAKRVSLGEPVDKKTAESIVRGFPTITNVNDGRTALFPIATVGKILHHRGFDFSRIIDDIPYLYETSVLGWSEPEILKLGHKEHTNIKEYHHYVNKFTDEIDEYYIRFTLNEENAKPKNAGRNIIHSVAISDISIYKKGDHSQHDRLKVPGEASPSPFVDRKLQEFFSLNNNIGDFP